MRDALDDLHPSADASLERPRRAAPTRAIAALLETWPGRLILVVVVSQLLIPLHYYTVRRDEHDERFAWRMFSPMRMTKCTISATLDGAPLALKNEFHEVWVAMARRPRFVVVEAMAAHLCEKYGHKPVVFNLDCKYLGQPPRSFGGTDMCNVPQLGARDGQDLQSPDPAAPRPGDSQSVRSSGG